MLKNYLNVAWRNLWNNKVFSLINVFGLITGLVSVMLILVYVRYELSYDRHLGNSERIYRLIFEDQTSGKSNEAPIGLGKVLEKEFAEVESSVQLSRMSAQFRIGDEVLEAEGIVAPSSFFQVFNFDLLKGGKKQILSEPYTLVLSEQIARRWFGTTNVIGKTITLIANGQPFRITGVMQDIPANTHFKADMILTIEESSWAKKPLSFNRKVFNQYILLGRNAHAASTERKFKSIYDKYNFPEKASVRLQPITDIHLRSDFEYELAPGGDIRYIYIFSGSALLILLIACVNFINLTTAKSLRRSKEVGIRKAMGAGRAQLIFQFLGESFILFGISLVCAVLIAGMLLPLFSDRLNIPLARAYFFDTQTLAWFVLIAGICGIAAGLYPALFLSGQRPVFVLKGVLKLPALNLQFRKLLVTAQFIIATVLITATLVVYSQLQFISHKRLGFDKELLVCLPWHNFKAQESAFKNELLKFSGIKNVSMADWKPGISYGGSTSWTDETDTAKRVSFDNLTVDIDFISTLGLEMDTGRMFSPNFGKDVVNIDSILEKTNNWDILKDRSIILNETAVKRLGLTSVVGKQISYPALRGTVVGIVKDFNGLSLHQKVAPVVLKAKIDIGTGFTFIRLRPGQVEKSLHNIEKVWKNFFPERAFEFSFVDDMLQQLYEAEKRLGNLFILFSILSIGISCLGLLGLAVFEVQQRTREIGIRKVLGASVAGVVALLSKDFIKLVLIAIVIASPIAWYAMDRWLEDFAYRIGLEWWMFALAGMLVIIIALVTVSFQSVKAALANPVKSLRSE